MKIAIISSICGIAIATCSFCLGILVAQRPLIIQPACTVLGHVHSEPAVNPRDYQIAVHMDTTWLYDNDRLVGVSIDSAYSFNGVHELIYKDNN